MTYFLHKRYHQIEEKRVYLFIVIKSFIFTFFFTFVISMIIYSNVTSNIIVNNNIKVYSTDDIPSGDMILLDKVVPQFKKINNVPIIYYTDTIKSNSLYSKYIKITSYDFQLINFSNLSQDDKFFQKALYRKNSFNQNQIYKLDNRSSSSTMYHEFVHLYHFNYLNESDNEFIIEHFKNEDKFVTEYAKTNYKEYFAETISEYLVYKFEYKFDDYAINYYLGNNSYEVVKKFIY